MRFLITSLQTYESEFYGVVGRELVDRGHSVVHLTESPRSAKELRSRGVDARAIQDVIAVLAEPVDLEEQVRRIEASYPIPHLRDVYRNDKACAGRPEEWCVRRTVDRFRAFERIVVVVPSRVLVRAGGPTRVTIRKSLIYKDLIDVILARMRVCGKVRRRQNRPSVTNIMPKQQKNGGKTDRGDWRSLDSAQAARKVK